MRVPEDLTEKALALAHGQAGVAEVSVSPAASREPGGDVLEVLAAREVVDVLLEGLEELGIPENGSIAVWTPDVVLGDRAEQAEAETPGDAADAVIWDELEQRTGADSRITWQYLVFLVAACNLAAIGIVTDSLIAIVGAMVIGPEFGPLAALAVAIVERRWKLARQAALALTVGFPAAMVTVALAAAVSLPLGLYDPAVVTGGDAAAEFISRPGPFSVIVAVIAGVVGMVSLTGNRPSALIGVFISVTTIPAAGYVAVALVVGAEDRAAGSALQLALNLAGIVLAAAAVLVLMRVTSPRLPERTRSALRRAAAQRGWRGQRGWKGRR